MKRKSHIALGALLLVLFASAAEGKQVKCVVTSIEGDKVVMTCKKAERLQVGDRVRVKPIKKKILEGC